MNSQEILQKMQGSEYATGIDISKWNLSFDLDSDQIDKTIADDVVDFVGVRATVCYSGSGHVEKDPLFDQFYDELEQHPDKVRIAYAFLNKDQKWTIQYDKFVETLDGYDFDVLCPDAEHHHLYNNLSYANDASRFAGGIYYFERQLRRDFPGKRTLLYSNRSTCQYYLYPHYPDLKDIPLWIASWPYNSWVNMPDSWWAGFQAWITGVLTGKRQPVMPVGVPQNQYEVWQLAYGTGIGEELGLGQDNVDTNVSRRKLEEFRIWSGIYNRIEAPPGMITDKQKLDILWAHHEELHPEEV